jgi:hypothetical protein
VPWTINTLVMIRIYSRNVLYPCRAYYVNATAGEYDLAGILDRAGELLNAGELDNIGVDGI